MKQRQTSIFSVDVEDWFNISAVGTEPPVTEWDSLPSCVEKNFRDMLTIFREKNVKVTCFFLGYFAKRFPELVREAVAQGHEIASHSYYHRLAYDLTPEQFLTDIRDAKHTLEDLAGVEVRGFRAPAFSVTPRNLWFFDKLIEAGYTYDSSVFPAPHQIGGLPGSPLFPHRIVREGGELMEFPITAVDLLGKPMCFFGGGYLRLFPYPVIKTMAQHALRSDRPVIYYVHPREIDPHHPRLEMSRKRTFTTYVNLSTTRRKIEKILRDFPVTTFAQYIEDHPQLPLGPPLAA